MPKLARVLLSEIDEPEVPIRVAMDERKMDELVESMREIGLLHPIVLKPHGARYEIEAGHRRYRAAVILKWRDIPALIFKASELAAGAAMLAENVIREDITAAEEAVLFAQAQEKFSLDEAGLVKRFHRSPDYISARLSLLRNDPEVFQACLNHKISFSVARELNKCDDETHRRYLLDAAMRSGVGTSTVAGWVAQWKAQPIMSVDVAPADVPQTASQVEQEPSLACCLCGGFRDPYNLVSVYIHKWELAEIQKLMQRAPDEVAAK